MHPTKKIIWHKKRFHQEFNHSRKKNLCMKQGRSISSLTLNIYVTAAPRRNEPISRNGLKEWLLIFLINVKDNNAPVCNQNILTIHKLGVKCCIHLWNDHVKAIQPTLPVKQGPGTTVHFWKYEHISFHIFGLNVHPWIHSAGEIWSSRNGSGWNIHSEGNNNQLFVRERGGKCRIYNIIQNRGK